MNKINHQLLHLGPVRTEARRLAWEHFSKELRKDGKDPNLISPQQKENAITVILWNAGDIFLQRAKWNLGERT